MLLMALPLKTISFSRLYDKQSLLKKYSYPLLHGKRTLNYNKALKKYFFTMIIFMIIYFFDYIFYDYIFL